MRSFLVYLATNVALLLSISPSLFSYQAASASQILHERQNDDLQSFTGSLGGSAPPITNSGDQQRPFEVDGNTFTNFQSAAQRSCDVQFQSCQLAANEKQQFTVSDCDDQKNQCNDAQTQTQDQSFDTSPQAQGQIDPDFDLVCDE